MKQSADLGIPALPGMGEQGSDFSSLISGTHTLRVAAAGPDKSKVALLGDLSESSVIRNGSDVWTWSSSDNAVTHATIDASDRDAKSDEAPARRPQDPAGGRDPLPDRCRTDHRGQRRDRHDRLAGRAAYELVLTPKQTGSLLSSVRIAVDGTEHVALRVQVFAGDRADPVAAIGFTEVEFATPAATEFAFTPPKEATVTEVTPEDHAGLNEKTDADARAAAEPKIVGEGWTTVVVGTLPEGDQSAGGADEQGERSDGPDLQAYLAQLPKVSGSWGSGRLLAGTAFSVVITDDGRVAAGAVGPDLLYDALG